MLKNKNVNDDIDVILDTLNQLEHDFNKLKTMTGKSLVNHLKTVVSNTRNLIDVYNLE